MLLLRMVEHTVTRKNPELAEQVAYVEWVSQSWLVAVNKERFLEPCRCMKWTVVLDRCVLSAQSVLEGLGARDTDPDGKQNLPLVSSEYRTKCPRDRGVLLCTQVG